MFLALIVCIIVSISLIGSKDIPNCKILGFIIVGLFGCLASGGMVSVLGPGPAVDSAGAFIRDAGGHSLYRYWDAVSIHGYMLSTGLLSIGCIISGVILLIIKKSYGVSKCPKSENQ